MRKPAALDNKVIDTFSPAKLYGDYGKLVADTGFDKEGKFNYDVDYAGAKASASSAKQTVDGLIALDDKYGRYSPEERQVLDMMSKNYGTLTDAYGEYADYKSNYASREEYERAAKRAAENEVVARDYDRLVNNGTGNADFKEKRLHGGDGKIFDSGATSGDYTQWLLDSYDPWKHTAAAQSSEFENDDERAAAYRRYAYSRMSLEELESVMNTLEDERVRLYEQGGYQTTAEGEETERRINFVINEDRGLIAYYIEQRKLEAKRGNFAKEDGKYTALAEKVWGEYSNQAWVGDDGDTGDFYIKDNSGEDYTGKVGELPFWDYLSDESNWSAAYQKLVDGLADESKDTERGVGRVNNAELIYLSLFDTERAKHIYGHIRMDDGDAIAISNIDRMTDSEKAIYLTLYNEKGEKAAEEYLAHLKDELEYRVSADRDKHIYDTANSGWFARHDASLLSVPMKVLGMFGGLEATIRERFGGDVSPYDRAFAANDIANALRRPQRDHLLEDWGEWAAVGYDTTMSILDNLARYAVAKGFGSLAGLTSGMTVMEATEWASKASMTIMAGEVYTESLSEGLRKNDDFWTAANMAAFEAFTEYITEKVSIEVLFDALDKDNLKTWKEVLNTIVTGTISEGSEEGASDLLNRLGDVLIHGGADEISLKIGEMQASGMSREEATDKAWKEFWSTMGLDVLSGAISGFVYGAAGSVKKAWSESLYDKATQDARSVVNNVMSEWTADDWGGALEVLADGEGEQSKTGISAEDARSAGEALYNDREAMASRFNELLDSGIGVEAALSSTLEEFAGKTGIDGAREAVGAVAVDIFERANAATKSNYILKRTYPLPVDENNEAYDLTRKQKRAVKREFKNEYKNGMRERINKAAATGSAKEAAGHEIERFNKKTVEKYGLSNGAVTYDFGVTQEQIDSYVDSAYSNSESKSLVEYASVSNSLIGDIAAPELEGYTHALRGNDIRHIRNSHGEKTAEAHPVTADDIKNIPYIVQNYDKVYRISNGDKSGVLYVKVNGDGTVYYFEQSTTKYNGKSLLVNKQMIKTGMNSIPGIKSYKTAITQKQTESEFLADLNKIRQEYVQDAKHNQSVDDSVSQKNGDVKEKSSKSKGAVKAGNGKDIYIVKRKNGTFVDESGTLSNEACDVLSFVAEAAGFDLRVLNTLESGARGEFYERFNKIRLESKGNTASVLLHELGEFTVIWAPERFALIKEGFETYLTAKHGEKAVEALILDACKRYDLDSENEKDLQKAWKEVVCDHLEAAMKDPDFAKKFAMTLGKEIGKKDSGKFKKIIETVKDWLKQFADMVKSFFDKYNGTMSTWAGNLVKADVEYCTRLSTDFNLALSDALKNYREYVGSDELRNAKHDAEYMLARDIPIVSTEGVAPASEKESANLEALDPRNMSRYKRDVLSVLNNSFPANKLVMIGKPSEILARYMKSDKTLYMPQSAVRKMALPADEKGGKHGLGIEVVEDLPYQFFAPLAITKNTTRHQNFNDNSIVVWCDWVTEKGDPIVVPIRIGAQGNVGIYNNVNTGFDIFDPDYLEDLIGDPNNVLYTNENKNIRKLLSETQRREVPKRKATDALTVNNISQSNEDVNTEISEKSMPTELDVSSMSPDEIVARLKAESERVDAADARADSDRSRANAAEAELREFKDKAAAEQAETEEALSASEKTVKALQSIINFLKKEKKSGGGHYVKTEACRGVIGEFAKKNGLSLNQNLIKKFGSRLARIYNGMLNASAVEYSGEQALGLGSVRQAEP